MDSRCRSAVKAALPLGEPARTFSKPPTWNSHSSQVALGGIAVSSRDYLVWSNEHRAWWGKNQWGYVEHIDEAHRFSRGEALEVCLATMPDRRSYPINDILVRLED